MAKRKSPRKRVNRFVFIYEFDYKVTQMFYNKFEQDLEATKVALSLERQRIATQVT